MKWILLFLVMIPLPIQALSIPLTNQNSYSIEGSLMWYALGTSSPIDITEYCSGSEKQVKLLPNVEHELTCNIKATNIPGTAKPLTIYGEIVSPNGDVTQTHKYAVSAMCDSDSSLCGWGEFCFLMDNNFPRKSPAEVLDAINAIKNVVSDIPDVDSKKVDLGCLPNNDELKANLRDYLGATKLTTKSVDCRSYKTPEDCANSGCEWVKEGGFLGFGATEKCQAGDVLKKVSLRLEDVNGDETAKADEGFVSARINGQCLATDQSDFNFLEVYTNELPDRIEGAVCCDDGGSTCPQVCEDGGYLEGSSTSPAKYSKCKAGQGSVSIECVSKKNLEMAHCRSCTVDWGDGKKTVYTPDVLDPITEVFGHFYTSSGQKTVTLECYGAKGKEYTDSKTVDVNRPADSSFSWSDYMTSVKDQRNCGSCWAHAIAGVMEAVRNKERGNNENLDLSEQDLVSCSFKNGCEGISFPVALDAIRNKGVVEESCIPYAAKDENCPNKRPSCKAWTILESGKVQKDVDSVKFALRKYGPLAASPCISLGNYLPYGECRVDTCPADSEHAVVILGYGEDSYGDGNWIIKNSWGDKWMDGGYANVVYGKCSIESNVWYVKGVVEKN